MGRYFAVFDPPGYQYPDEPGACFSWTGEQVLDQLLAQGPSGTILNPANKFYNPPGSIWLIPRPRQFAADWERDSRLDQHVLTKSLWGFATGVICAEFELTLKADGTTFPKNKFLHFTSIPSSITSLDATNYPNLWAAAGLQSASLPSGMKTVAHTSQTPVGASLAGNANLFTPQLRWAGLPAPDGVFVFGWSNFAWLVFNHKVILLQSPLGDRVTWRRLGEMSFEGFASYRPKHVSALEAFAQGAFFWDSTIRARTLTALPVGFNDLYHYANGAPLSVSLRTFNDGSPLFPAGSWWIGAPANAHFWLQAQVVGYELASTDDLFSGANPSSLWNLGLYGTTSDGGGPLVNPERLPGILLPQPVPTDLVQTDTDGILSYQSPETGCRVDFSVTDESYATLSADGTHWNGGVFLYLQPGTQGATLGSIDVDSGGYVCPQVQAVTIRFVVVFTDREAVNLTLDDTQWKKIRAEVSLRDARYKRFEIDLPEGGAAAFFAAGLDRRGNYPVHIMEDVNNDGEPDTLRIRAWVDKPTLAYQWTVDDDDGNGVRTFTVKGKGILARVDRDPAYLPQVVQPLSPRVGAIEHTFLVKTALASSGLDPDDPMVEIAEDFFADSITSFVPGTWGLNGQGPELLDNHNQGSMRWDETWLGYAERIGHDFEGWLIYESLNTVRYTPDAAFDFLSGAPLFIAAYVFKSHADAIAAGVNPQQCYLDGGTEDILEPVANRIRTTGISDLNRLMPHSLDTRPTAWTDPTDENYTGEPITKGYVVDLGVGELALQRTTRSLLLQDMRRLFFPSWKVMLAPWHFDAIDNTTIDVGAVLSVQGYRDEVLLVHLALEIVMSRTGDGVTGSVVTTRLTGEKVPHGTAVSASGGFYPGVGG